MKKTKQLCVISVSVAAAAGILWGLFGQRIRTLYTSLNSFKDENLAHTFQHTIEI